MPTAQQAYTVLGNETLWEGAHAALESAGVPHAIVGGMAVCLHGYRRNTVDVDLLVRREDSQRIRDALSAVQFTWLSERKEFRSPSGVAIPFLLAGDPAGDDHEVRIPDPDDAQDVVTRDNLPCLSLSRLIEVKIACGSGNLRRTHKDFADVVELIAVHGLSRSFARHLHESVRPAFRTLVLHARGDAGD